MDALQAKMEVVSAEFAAAGQSGDQARIAASQRAMDALSAEYTALFAEAEDPQLLESIALVTEQDRTMSIVIEVNPGGISDSEWRRVGAPRHCIGGGRARALAAAPPRGGARSCR
jgi:hypothetical protein